MYTSHAQSILSVHTNTPADMGRIKIESKTILSYNSQKPQMGPPNKLSPIGPYHNKFMDTYETNFISTNIPNQQLPNLSQFHKNLANALCNMESQINGNKKGRFSNGSLEQSLGDEFVTWYCVRQPHKHPANEAIYTMKKVGEGKQLLAARILHHYKVVSHYYWLHHHHHHHHHRHHYQRNDHEVVELLLCSNVRA
uniref:Uncharacterized protein n=1 Tax=Glossina palpalis gambiensis TaxID=67801 RepID=A0A1B0B540_9MUSC